jgi:hypothetical protein
LGDQSFSNGIGIDNNGAYGTVNKCIDNFKRNYLLIGGDKRRNKKKKKKKKKKKML